ncbi:hypothetical protein PMI30_05827 [Pseudomonas sp. GM50]|jgi:hypothetical protein|uniref:hypothetical protein n=1 Tax=Pseudomonas sp. GM50 TaxID=1144332 RepID=UPI0002709144|nr:hypothetical protein [Pseudomonas sp. GM50]EJM59517.1 hypothetical protein PMI30_05827 [Pseudomonas sp. GM50]
MNNLERNKIMALPKAKGNLFAKTTRWPTSDPRNTIDTGDVYFIDDVVVGNYQVGGRVNDDQSDYFTSVTFEIPRDTQSGVYDIKPGVIEARYGIVLGEDSELYRAVSGKIKLTVNSEGTHFEAEDFHFVARIGSAGKTAELFLGNFNILF